MLMLNHYIGNCPTYQHHSSEIYIKYLVPLFNFYIGIVTYCHDTCIAMQDIECAKFLDGLADKRVYAFFT